MRLRSPARQSLRGPWSARCGEGEWFEAGEASTAAAALRATGQWSLDGPRTDFDAQAWSLRTRFAAPPMKQPRLQLDGLATACEVFLNGEQLLRSESMFEAHTLDVGKLLRATQNELVIRCDPLAKLLQAKRPRPRWRVPMLSQQQLRGIRTTLLGRTPGWSPPVAVVGAWRDVSIEDAAACESVRLRVAVENGEGRADVTLHAPGCGAGDRIALRLHRGGEEWTEPLVRSGSGEWQGSLRIARPVLWWPHTHGEPCVYEASIVHQPPSGAAQELPLHPIGFRVLEVDTRGGGFTVRVNGERIFCRGAVWTPLDVVTLRSEPAQLAAAIAQVRAAGMNMLRVPGTGVYEEDAFYEACDRAGLLVWQDFMFANMDYPFEDAHFLSQVEHEVGQQLRRLHAHPCIAVLCGNSEVEQQASMWGASRQLWEPQFFHATLPTWCEQHAPGVPYWPSSAHGGALPQQPDQGTTSYYGVGAYLRPLDDARASGLRFATECLAFANVPPASTLERLPGGTSTRPHHAGWKERSPRDLGAGWDFDDVRDHYLRLLFEEEPQPLRATDGERYLALSRLASAEAMAAAMAQWRTGERCDGALVLMLRDLWAGAGWGLLDERGLPKACWHALARTMQPLTLLVTDEGLNGLALHVVNDTAQPFSGSVALDARRDGEVLVAQGERALQVPPRSRVRVAAAELLDHFIDLNWAWRFGPPPCDVVSCTLYDERHAKIARTHHFSHGRGPVARRGARLEAEMKTLDAQTREVRVRARGTAMGVHIDWPGLVPGDGDFHLADGEEHSVLLQGEPRVPSGHVAAVNAPDIALREAKSP